MSVAPAFRPPPSPPSVDRCAFISVIVPVRNEERHIGALLRQLLAQDYRADRFEIVIADGRSTDTTRAIVRDFQRRDLRVRLVDNPGIRSSSGRNAAIQVARGDIIVIIDGHCDIPSTHHLSALADAFERSQAACVGRPQPLDVSNAGPFGRAVAAARTSWLGHHPQSHIYSAGERFVPPQSVAVAYRRKVFDTVGGFDETFDACEDVEFNHRLHRAGHRCFFTSAVGVRYFPRSTVSGLFYQMIRYGRGRARLLFKHPDTFSLAGFVPAAFVAGIGLLALLAVCSPLRLIPLAMPLGVYGLTVFTFSISITAQRRDWSLLGRLPLVFAAIHFGSGFGILCELLPGGLRRAFTHLA
jgi:succinoglycan biosynthesis protein ExoA